MAFIHELDIPVFFPFCLYTSNSFTFSISPTLRRSTQLKSGVSPRLPRCVSHTNTLWTFPFSLSCCFIHLHHMIGVLLDPSLISQMPSKHFTSTLQTNICFGYHISFSIC